MGPVFIVVQVDHLDAITGDLLLFHRFIEEYSNNILEREREIERERKREQERNPVYISSFLTTSYTLQKEEINSKRKRWRETETENPV